MVSLLTPSLDGTRASCRASCMARPGKTTIKFSGLVSMVLVLSRNYFAAAPSFAHHAILAKFDDKKPQTLNGIVELVEWKNPHVHVFMNVQGSGGFARWVLELESVIDLERSGWTRESLRPGDAITVQGLAARDATHQVWANSIVVKSTGKKVLDVTPSAPPVAKQVRPTPRYPDGQPRLGSPAESGYWAYPSATSLVETGVNVQMTPMACYATSRTPAKWRRFRSGPKTCTNCGSAFSCKAIRCTFTASPRVDHASISLPYGVQFVDNRDFKRIFVLIGSGNRNFRMIYTDGRKNTTAGR